MYPNFYNIIGRSSGKQRLYYLNYYQRVHPGQEALRIKQIGHKDTSPLATVRLRFTSTLP